MPDCPKCPPSGLPPWVVTFADLMTLLMCFFVMLLSMANMDVAKFKSVAISLAQAFGVQSVFQNEQIFKGSGTMEQHFNPGGGKPMLNNGKLDISSLATRLAKEKNLPGKLKEIHLETQKIQHALQDEINKGQVSVANNNFRITIRINEKGSFPSASAMFQKGFEPVMDKIAGVLAKTQGKIIISGHTDDIPIRTSAFRSNWELSSARSVSVAHFLLANKGVEPMRLLIEGYADTQPLVPNDSPANRAINRRVDIVIAQDNLDKEKVELKQ